MNFGKMAIHQAEKDSRMVVCQRNSLVVVKNKLAGKFHESKRERSTVIFLSISLIIYYRKWRYFL